VLLFVVGGGMGECIAFVGEVVLLVEFIELRVGFGSEQLSVIPL
jgi:hypothetical protein